MRSPVMEWLFSLFTSPDRAEAIAGDLTEERARRGSTWFWLQVCRTLLALWRSAVMDGPLRVIGLTLAGAVLFIGPAFVGVAAFGLFPHLMGSFVTWSALAFCWWGGALWVGATLTNLDPRRGSTACATLAVSSGLLLLAAGIESPTALLVPVLILIGGVMARRRLAAMLVPCAVLLIAAPVWAQQIDWKDPAPHTTRLVTVDEGVQLEVLDWGGSGPAIVLLAGLGDTAHVFDDFAPMLVPRHRVIAITRRAHGRSSAPPAGYGFARLAEDIVRVLDATGVQKPVVVGHSFAGEEMHVLGSRYADRIAGLVYIDAAFDRGDDADSAAYNAVAKTLPPAPAPGDGDRASFGALRAFLEKTQRTRFPESHLRARYLANADGTVGRMWAPDGPVRQEMSKEMQAAYKPYSPERIRVPALAIYAAPKTAADMMRPWYPAGDAQLQENVGKLFVLQRARVENHIKWFRQFAPQGRVAEIAGPHHLFVSHPKEVLAHIEAFVK